MRAQYRTQAARASAHADPASHLRFFPRHHVSGCARPCAEHSSPVSRWLRDATSPCPRCSAFVLTLSDSMLSSSGATPTWPSMVLLLPFPTMWNLEEVHADARVIGIQTRVPPIHQRAAWPVRARCICWPLACHEIAASSVATNRRSATRNAWRERTSASVFASGWKPLPETTQTTSIVEAEKSL